MTTTTVTTAPTTTTATHLLERRLGMSRVRRHCMLTLYECNNSERQRQRRRRRQNYYEPNSARATLTHLSGSPLRCPRPHPLSSIGSCAHLPKNRCRGPNSKWSCVCRAVKRGGSCVRASIVASTSVSAQQPLRAWLCVCVYKHMCVFDCVQRLLQIYVKTISRRTSIKRH